MITARIQSGLSKMNALMHPNCIVCDSSNERCMGLEFLFNRDGSVQATFSCDKAFEGYENFLHGGVISSLLDGAMTNCLFAHGCIAVTAELKIRFRHPVAIGIPATVRARMIRSSTVLHILKGEIEQDRQVKATAVGKFMEQPSLIKRKEAVALER